MKFEMLSIAIISVVLQLEFSVEVYAKLKTPGKILQLKSRPNAIRRAHVIKCCGSDSCFGKNLKTRTASNIFNTTLSNSAKTTHKMSNELTGTINTNTVAESFSSELNSNTDVSAPMSSLDPNTSTDETITPMTTSTDLALSTEVLSKFTENQISSQQSSILTSEIASNPVQASSSNTDAFIKTTFSTLLSSSETSTINFATTTTTPETTTATTKPTTTTTKPPTIQELLSGKCDTSFDLDPKTFDTDGSLKDPDQYGFWIQAGGQQFVFGKFLVDWRQNFITCFKIGMEPLTFDTAAKMNTLKSLSPTWKYTTNFWTAANRVGPQNFSWCKKNGSAEINSTNIPWGFNQPDNINQSQNCLHIRVIKSNSSLYFSDRMCTDTYFLSCQGRPTLAPRCLNPICPTINCTKNIDDFYLYDNTTRLLDLKKHGKWYRMNGRLYVFSYANATQTFAGALDACCKIGMSLLSLEYQTKYAALKSAVENKETQSDFYWTSGVDMGCEAKYGFCTSNRTLRDKTIWAPGQPDNAGGIENTLAVFINSSHVQLFDFSEKKKFRYICESRDNSKAAAGGAAVASECALIFNVSQIEIDALLNLTMKFDIRIKCFLKCVGEYAGLLENGKLLDYSIIVTLEALANTNLTELLRNLLALDECWNTTSGMDECDKAAQMIKCSNEKSPDVLDSVISTMDSQMSLEKFEPEPPCIKIYIPENFTISIPIHNCDVPPCNTPYGLVKSNCGKKYFHTANKYNYTFAWRACYEAGLIFSYFINPSDVQCVLDAFGNTSSSNVWIGASPTNSLHDVVWCVYEDSVPFDPHVFATFSINSGPDNAFCMNYTNNAVMTANIATEYNVLCQNL
ncbi:uncharacterized protein LOC132198808 [Neocloeon triangulifer]|uniref:uncharacterized protein LOC132198808 n=1 Tax=Neocloeon triangulifer TaxID=2078957 RepID=UPI00286F5A29|nr:uncharacterized protein LOC132198808 [Neocloeon triangulifer]